MAKDAATMEKTIIWKVVGGSVWPSMNVILEFFGERDGEVAV